MGGFTDFHRFPFFFPVIVISDDCIFDRYRNMNFCVNNITYYIKLYAFLKNGVQYFHKKSN